MMIDSIQTEADTVALREQARQCRDRVFSNKVFVRAVIEVSNYCRQNCNYCGIRGGNRELERYRLEQDDIRRIVYDAIPDAVTDINIQTGEDPTGVRKNILPLVEEFSKNTPYGISLCLGSLDTKLYDELYQAGARYYIIKLESGNAEHYRQIQAPGKDLKKRLEVIRYLAASGWKVSSGFISGLPFQTAAHVSETMELLKTLPLAGVSVSPFIPGDCTPYHDQPIGNLDHTLNYLAALRLAFPSYIIPAVSAMNIAGPDGYVKAFQSGANLGTINMTPEIKRDAYPIYKKDRYIMYETRVLEAIEAAGLQPSTKSMIAHLSG